MVVNVLFYNSSNFLCGAKRAEENYNTEYNRVLMHKAISEKLCNLIFSKNPLQFCSAAEKLTGIQRITLLQAKNKFYAWFEVTMKRKYQGIV